MRSDHWLGTKAPSELIAQYEGKHIAIVGERIVDADRDFDALGQRLETNDSIPMNRVLFRYVPSPRPDVIDVTPMLLKEDSVSENDAEAILQGLARYFGTEPEDGMYSAPNSPMNRLVRKMHRSRWGTLLGRIILTRYLEGSDQDRAVLGGLYGYLTGYLRGSRRKGAKLALWCWDRVDELCEATGPDAVAATLRLWPVACYGFPKRKRLVHRLTCRLADMLNDSPAAAHAATYVLQHLKQQPELTLNTGKTL